MADGMSDMDAAPRRHAIGELRGPRAATVEGRTVTRYREDGAFDWYTMHWTKWGARRAAALYERTGKVREPGQEHAGFAAMIVRSAGFVLIALGALLALPQICVDAPDHRVFLAGLAVGFIGALVLCDHPPEGTRGRG